MIEEFARQIPESLMDKSGSVFYSGRLAFNSQSDLYILGANPGGDPEEQGSETIDWHTKNVLNSVPQDWSAYRDESWLGTEPGTKGMQPRLLHLFSELDLNPGSVPSSNVVFVRSARVSTLLGYSYEDLASHCWDFHQTVIDGLGVRVVACLGRDAGEWTCSKLHAHRQVSEFVEDNKRRWASRVYANAVGQKVAVLTHPSVADWTNPKTDPTWLVGNALNSLK